MASRVDSMFAPVKKLVSERDKITDEEFTKIRKALLHDKSKGLELDNNMVHFEYWSYKYYVSKHDGLWCLFTKIRTSEGEMSYCVLREGRNLQGFLVQVNKYLGVEK